MKLITYDKLYIDSLVRKRTGEIRFGEKVQTLSESDNGITSALLNSPCRYVLLGLPEDIGVRANGGRGGSYSAWLPVLNTLLNSQSNVFLGGDELLVLGHVDFTEEMNVVKDFDFHNQKDLDASRTIVSNIDDYVAPLIQQIVAAGKEVIVIGGGHNNAYPIIKGAAMGLMEAGKINKASINVMNCDAHSDFRLLEGRHSGNPFSYAFRDNYLKKYSVTGLHESYNTGSVMEELIHQKDRIQFTTFEDIFVREKLSFDEATETAINFTNDTYSGLEIDIDSIQNIPSSAKTSSGISTIEARKFIYKAALNNKIPYFHIAEAAPVLSHIKTDLKTGKLVTYLITDYLKARNDSFRK